MSKKSIVRVLISLLKHLVYSIIPDYIHPVHHKSLRSLLNSLKIPPNEPQMHKVIPFPRLPLSTGTTSPYKCIPPVPETLTYWTYPATSHPPAFTHTDTRGKLNAHHPKRKTTYLMSTLNATPDSFSDGSMYDTPPTALSYARESVSAGAAIVDVGGHSTRPGAASVGVQEEIDRVVPIVQAIRLAASTNEEGGEESEKLRHILISVDTFRWEVAEAAVRAGANCINDVCAFTGPDYFLEVEGEEAVQRVEAYREGMKRVAREYATPCVLMHSRGDAGQNKGYKAMYGYAGPRGAVVEGVRVELGQKVDEVVRGRGGVRRWLVVADPGVGFSKTVEGNLEVLRDAKGMVEDVLVGQGLFVVLFLCPCSA
jgi:dihydropteroate synthase